MMNSEPTNTAPHEGDFEISRTRFTVGVGVAAIVSTVFALLRGAPPTISFVNVTAPAAIVLVACGIAAIVSGLSRRRIIAIVAGAVLLGAALLQLVQLNAPANLLGGDASTMALLGGLGIALLSCGLIAGRVAD
jgi:uncharacterized membrane protein HdeD (DUF308 family)